MQANQYLTDRASECRRLARRQRQPEMAQALIELAEVYELQLQGFQDRGPRQMR